MSPGHSFRCASVASTIIGSALRPFPPGGTRLKDSGIRINVATLVGLVKSFVSSFTHLPSPLTAIQSKEQSHCAIPPVS